ncbi:NAD(P)-dependent alcohol dehydrogenase [Actinomadura graeca]|uniref:NAD(P)-dependent alcohol dehydrogenase n=1 Tax=Actinomadura graeca TaxID=2750812 RepID=A0ABX8QU45_9ACTN|nr:NAD(P)-dependent alcohol dehydrogenase [Actinomadura graeca]QXJ22310.1 NAD(P)-dependent alcohol dehydrogenase [Actinomadura graeca]
MKAIVQERFGPPDVLRPADVDRPRPGTGEVVVRVHAAAVNPYEWHLLRGDPYVARLMMGGMGLTRPKNPVAGLDAAGCVEEVGPGVGGVRPGDEVFGFCPGAFAEFARAKAELVVPRPEGLSFAEAAALPIAGTTALRAVRDVGAVTSGQRVLVNGAAGGVGTYAVQIAAALGAEVTGVCGTRNLDLVRSIGAAHAVDHTETDFTADECVRAAGRYDVILDNVGNHPLGRLRRALTPAGTLLLNAGGSPGAVFGAVGRMARGAMLDRFVRQRIRVVPTAWRRQDLLDLADLAASGRLTTVLDRGFPLAEAADAVRYIERGHARGKVVLSVTPAGGEGHGARGTRGARGEGCRPR